MEQIQLYSSSVTCGVIYASRDDGTDTVYMRSVAVSFTSLVISV